jgi:hypothetical protein
VASPTYKHQLNGGFSESRISNSNVDILNLDEALATVLTSEGTRSDYFPADLRSLLSYDSMCEASRLPLRGLLTIDDVDDATKKLVKDYGLVEAEESEMNIKRFLVHIGEQWAVGNVFSRLTYKGKPKV